ncbi:MAG: hypothetical protein KKE17_14870 [Proteobacteria bacterium]|nr:hypothetical protein [Pseudomonadota bacterium]
MNSNNIERVDLAYSGRVPPEVYGVSYDHLIQATRLRYAVISSNLLWGRMYFINGTEYWPQDRNTYIAFRELKPLKVIGHTLYVYDMKNATRAVQ